MFHTTSALAYTGRGSLNSRTANTSFYFLHVLPEWLATALMVTFNIRRMFGSGPFGDWRYRDETTKGRQKREKREAKRAERRKEKLAKRDALNHVKDSEK